MLAGAKSIQKKQILLKKMNFIDKNEDRQRKKGKVQHESQQVKKNKTIELKDNKQLSCEKKYVNYLPKLALKFLKTEDQINKSTKSIQEDKYFKQKRLKRQSNSVDNKLVNYKNEQFCPSNNYSIKRVRERCFTSLEINNKINKNESEEDVNKKYFQNLGNSLTPKLKNNSNLSNLKSIVSRLYNEIGKSSKNRRSLTSASEREQTKQQQDQTNFNDAIQYRKKCNSNREIQKPKNKVEELKQRNGNSLKIIRGEDRKFNQRYYQIKQKIKQKYQKSRKKYQTQFGNILDLIRKSQQKNSFSEKNSIQKDFIINSFRNHDQSAKKQTMSAFNTLDLQSQNSIKRNSLLSGLQSGLVSTKRKSNQQISSTSALKQQASKKDKMQVHCTDIRQMSRKQYGQYVFVLDRRYDLNQKRNQFHKESPFENIKEKKKKKPANFIQTKLLCCPWANDNKNNFEDEQLLIRQSKITQNSELEQF